VNSVKLFVTATIVGGFGGFAGSALGNAFGQQGLFVGGFAGGALLAPDTAAIARWRRWIAPSRYWAVTAGAALGFLAAAAIAVNTLSSPVGPLVATTLTGLGAVAGARLGPDRG
jgi:hypothetical protein